jgi:hypothetical protein
MALRLGLSVFAIALHVSSASGNVGFWPGDAFFHFRLTEAAMAEMSDTEIQLTYAPTPPGGLYSGFHHLKITGDTAAMNRQLRQLQALLRAESTTMPDGFHGFVYNADMNWSAERHRIGIKYNESWAELPVQYLDHQTPRPSARQSALHHYHTLINVPDAIIHDWQFSRDVEGLAVEIPQGVKWTPEWKGDTPISVDAGQIQMVVITQPDLAPYFYRQDNSRFYVVTNQSLRRAQFRDGTVTFTECSPGKPTDDELGPESHGLRVRLISAQEEFVVGQPARFRLEMQNTSDRLIRYDDQGVGVNDPMEVVDPHGRRVRYVWGPVSTGRSGELPGLGPGETTVLLDDYDLCDQYLLTEPGIYSVQYRQDAAFLPPSNAVRFKMSPGTLPLDMKVPAALLTILPADWDIHLNSRVFRVENNEITPVGWESGPGTYVALKSHSSNKQDPWGVAIWVAERKLAWTGKFRSGKAVKSEDAATYLGKGADGHVYWTLPPRAETEWQDIRAKVAEALQIQPGTSD